MAYPTKWIFLLLSCYVCVSTGKHSSVPSTTGGSSSSPEKKAPHIHKHNGDLTSVRSSNIIKEEGRYFLRQLFKKYGTGREMDVISLEVFLGDLGYNTESDLEEREGDHGLTGGHTGGGERHGGGETDRPDVDNGKDKELHENRTGISQGKDERTAGHLGKDDDIHTKSQNNYESGGLKISDETNEDMSEQIDDVSGGQGKTNDTYEDVDDDEHVTPTEKTENSDTENVQDAKKKHGGKKHKGRGKGKQGQGHNKKAKHEIGGDNSDAAVVDDVASSDGDVVRGESKDNPTANDENGDEGKQSRKKHRFSRRQLHKVSDAEKSDVNDHKRQKIPEGSADSGTDRRKRSTGSVIFHSHDTHTDCMTADQLIKTFHFDEQQKITQTDFLYISPAIVYQLSKRQCRPSRLRNPGHLRPPSNDTVSSGIPARVWGYSFVAVLVISLVGLLGVAVIPIMQKVFYNQLLQFLVALAVGALTGDAMLHLLPHAIAGEEKDPVAPEDNYGGTEDSQEHGLHGAIWKGLCGLLGIYFFFIIQQVLTIVTGVRDRKRKKKALKLAKKGFAEKADLSSVYDDELIVRAPVPGQEDLEQSVPLKSDTGESSHASGHGHSHNSGPLPTSVSAMAWMVILGDGVHNFSDGLAIGAAFANSITGGFSTAIAVFCHELPHEIGDFAVLIKSGMSVKQAVMYNVVSSVLCLVGMLIGVALGNIGDASIWIFAGVGGMFIYISLVTMIPELTSVTSDKPVRDLILQCLGISTGAGIMLLIAIYEDDLKKSLD